MEYRFIDAADYKVMMVCALLNRLKVHVKESY